MTTSISENRATAQDTAPITPKPGPPKKAKVAAPKTHVRPSQAKSANQTTPAKKAARAHKTPTMKVDGIRQGTKTAKVLKMVKRSGGATLKQIINATGWQTHSVRGFLSGTLGKQLGLKIESSKTNDGERVYSLAK
jgi:hypothetical protein